MKYKSQTTGKEYSDLEINDSYHVCKLMGYVGEREDFMREVLFIQSKKPLLTIRQFSIENGYTLPEHQGKYYAEEIIMIDGIVYIKKWNEDGIKEDPGFKYEQTNLKPKDIVLNPTIFKESLY